MAGSRLGLYEIVAPLGAGGMGEVYRARDAKLSRDVAIKVLPASFAADPDALARFEREAQAVAALSHPEHPRHLTTSAQRRRRPYAVMELLEGETLRQALDGGALPPRARDRIRACRSPTGLAAAHAQGHRPSRPEAGERVRHRATAASRSSTSVSRASRRRRRRRRATHVADDRRRTEPGTVMGTVGYMAPEQVRGEAVDHRADIFSFGACSTRCSPAGARSRASRLSTGCTPRCAPSRAILGR